MFTLVIRYIIHHQNQKMYFGDKTLKDFSITKLVFAILVMLLYNQNNQ